MLSETNERALRHAIDAPSHELSVSSGDVNMRIASDPLHVRLKKILRIEWLGQTVASICWITSMLFYGLSSIGDWLQLLAASAWLLANIASVANTNTSLNVGKTHADDRQTD